MKIFSKGTNAKYIFMLFLIQLIQIVTIAIAQTPTHLSRESTPVDFLGSPENIIVFIVLPVVIVILYFIWRMQRAKQKALNENNTKYEGGK